MKYIGIKLADGSFYPVLQKGSQEKKTLDLTTVKDNQTTVQVDLYSSDTGTMEGAEYVDTLEIQQLAPHPNGEPDLQLEVSIDENDNLHAQVLDPETGKSSRTQIVISKALSDRNRSDTEFSTDAKSEDTFDRDMMALSEADTTGQEDTFDNDMANIQSLSFGEGDDGSTTLNPDELVQLGQNTKLSVEEAENSSDTQREESMIGPSVNDETFTFEDSEVPAVSAEASRSAADTLSSEPEQTTDSITQALSEAEDKLTDTMNSISSTLSDFSADMENAAEDGFGDSGTGSTETDTTDFDLPDFSGLDTDSGTTIDDTAADEPTAETDSGAFDLPDFGDGDTSADSDLPDFSDLDADSNTTADDTADSSASDFDLPDFGDSGTGSTETDTTDFDLPDFSGLDTDSGTTADDAASDSSSDLDLPDFSDLDTDTGTAADEPAAETDSGAFDLPDFGDVDTSADTDFDLPDFGDDDSLSEAAAVSRAASADEEEFTMPDFGDTDSEPAEESTFAPTGGLDFNGLYDKETLEGDSSFNDDDVAATVKKKTKVPVIICIICAIICIIAAILVLFVIPSRINLLTRDAYKAKTDDAQAQIESALSQLPEPIALEPADPAVETAQPEPVVQIETHPQEVIVAQDDEIVVAENPETVVPDKPVASAEKAEDIRYKIKWGDTLWDIADAYYKNPWKYKNIASYNGIKNPDRIISGTWILIPAE